jgi:hypothetical protein
LALAQIATTTSGRERVEIPKIWGELPVKSRYVELAPWLLVSGAILFLLEVSERRTGWVSRLFRRKAALAAAETEETEIPQATPAPKSVFPRLVRKPVRTAIAPVAPGTKGTPPVSDVTAETEPTLGKSPRTESTIDALREARERAHRRTDKDH